MTNGIGDKFKTVAGDDGLKGAAERNKFLEALGGQEVNWTRTVNGKKVTTKIVRLTAADVEKSNLPAEEKKALIALIKANDKTGNGLTSGELAKALPEGADVNAMFKALNIEPPKEIKTEEIKLTDAQKKDAVGAAIDKLNEGKTEKVVSDKVKEKVLAMKPEQIAALFDKDGKIVDPAKLDAAIKTSKSDIEKAEKTENEAKDKKIVEKAIDTKLESAKGPDGKALSKEAKEAVKAHMIANGALKKDADLDALMKAGIEASLKADYKTNDESFLSFDGAYELLSGTGLLESPGFFREMFTLGTAKGDQLFGKARDKESVMQAMRDAGILVKKDVLVNGKVEQQEVVDKKILADYITKTLRTSKDVAATNDRDGYKKYSYSDKGDYFKLSGAGDDDKTTVSVADIDKRMEVVIQKKADKETNGKDMEKRAITSLTESYVLKRNVVTETTVAIVKSAKEDKSNIVTTKAAENAAQNEKPVDKKTDETIEVTPKK